jgi:RNA polymerase sigma factor (sigma-70 family)
MPADADIQQLLAHAEWLRGLARHLVRDDADAADVVQQTWAAALRAPPDPGRPARPWLAQVLRNFVRKNLRAARNRGARELAAGALESAAPSSEALLEAMQLQRLLGELVVALEEPYRSAILLRYYEGQEPVQIAESLGIPAGTVRWRVSEGISRLRGALGKRLGDERSWRLALLPLVSEPSTGKGALMAMSTKTKVALMVGAVGVTLAGGGLAWRAVGAASATRRSASAAGRPGEQVRAAAAALEPPGERTEVVPGGASPSDGEVGGAAPTRRRTPPRFVPARPAGDSPPAATVTGSLGKDDIREGIRAVVPAMKGCYDKLLMENPEASGKITVRFTIVEKEGQGRISDATIQPQTRDGGTAELISTVTESCILQVLAQATFTAPKGGPVIVSYPFVFTPGPRP